MYACDPQQANYVVQFTNRFVYDGWNLAVTLASDLGPLASFTWGADLSGSLRGAGGVGGLLSVTVHTGPNPGAYFSCCDGNGNVMGLINAADGSVAAQYEYGPFGELLRATGPLAKLNPIRFSTQYTDDETDLVCYLHRCYNPSTGNWASEDPINEPGFKLITGRKDKFAPEEEKNLYAFLDNDPVSDYDILGLSAGSAAGTCVGGLALVAASVPVGAIITGTVIVAGTAYIVWEMCHCKRYRCRPCNPAVGTLMHEIVPAKSRQRGRHVGIDHVKYWKMHQVPYTPTTPTAVVCACYWRYDHTDDNTLIPVQPSIPGGPPNPAGGPTLGGGLQAY